MPTRWSTRASRASSSRSRTPIRASPGAGIGRLREAGVEVDVGVGADAATTSCSRRTCTTGAPAVRTSSRSSRRASTARSPPPTARRSGSPPTPARADAHELRADSQAIVVGSGTAIADQPALTVRDVDPLPARPPLRVVLDGRGRVAAAGPLFDTGARADARRSRPTARRRPRSTRGGGRGQGRGRRRGGRRRCRPRRRDRAARSRRCACRCWSKAAARSSAALLAERHAQRLVTYVAPVLLGERGRPGYALPGPDTLADATRYRLVDVHRIGPDVRCDLRGGADVHRHRRGARPGARRHCRTTAARGSRSKPKRRASKTRRSATRSRSTAAASPSSSASRRAGPPTPSPRRWRARTSATCVPAIWSTSNARCGSPIGSAATSCRATSTAPASLRARTPQCRRLDDDAFDGPAEVLRYVVHKGSITVDGISLTVAGARRRRFRPSR